jgi:hypothetical protein
MGRMRTLDSNGISGFCCRGIGLFFVWEKGLAYRLWFNASLGITRAL